MSGGRGGQVSQARPAVRNRRAELLALTALVAQEGKWLPAVAVAEVVDMPWRPLAFALRRLAERGIVKEQIFVIRGTARTKEQQRRYLFGRDVTVNPFLPPMYETPPGAARLVRGWAGLANRWEKDDEREG